MLLLVFLNLSLFHTKIQRLDDKIYLQTQSYFDFLITALLSLKNYTLGGLIFNSLAALPPMTVDFCSKVVRNTSSRFHNVEQRPWGAPEKR